MDRDRLTGAPRITERVMVLAPESGSIPLRLHSHRLVQSDCHKGETLGQLEWTSRFTRYFGNAYAGHSAEWLAAQALWYHWIHEPYLVSRLYRHYPRPDAIPPVLALYRDDEDWQTIRRRYDHTLPWVERHYHRMTAFVRSTYLLEERNRLADRSAP